MLVQAGAKLVITDNSNNTVSVMRVDYDNDATNDLNSPILCVLCGSSVINNPIATNPDPITQAALRNGLGCNFRVIQDSKYFAPVAVAPVPSSGEPCAGDTPDALTGSTALASAALRAALAAR